MTPMTPMPPLKLFFVTMNNGKPLSANGGVIYFDKKFQAKVFRDSIEPGATVSRGPDHWVNRVNLGNQGASK